MPHKNPIIFNEWSIQRILAGEKTQTRRVVKPQPDEVVQGIPIEFTSHEVVDKERNELVEIKHGEDGGRFYKEVECPYGQPDDVLWVREAFRMPAVYDDQTPSWYTEKPVRPVKYCADDTYRTNKEVVGTKPIEWGRKRPSIHMPRELCRLRLRVEDVRVEQVQQISQEDAIAEGIPGDYVHGEEDREYTEAPHVCGPKYGGSAITEFRRLWNDIYGDGAWERNDWVWVIKFSWYDE
jgi:hypothetical protein